MKFVIYGLIKWQCSLKMHFHCTHSWPPIEPIAFEGIDFSISETLNGWLTSVKTTASNLFSNLRSSSSVTMTGLENLGNTCYMNSTIQTLYMCDRFREAVLNSSPTEDQLLLTELRTTFGCLLEIKGEHAYDPSRLLELAKPSWFQPKQQQDSSEFLRHILNQIHEEEEECGSKSNIVETMFGGTLEHVFTCKQCDHFITNKEMFFDLQLAFPRNNYLSKISLNTLFSNLFNTEKLKGDHKYYCEKCESFEDATRSMSITHFPKYLIFTLMRFTDYGIKNHHSKNTSPVDYPEEFLLYENKFSFALNGVIVHSGYTPYCGHYYCYGRSQSLHGLNDTNKGATTSNDEWFLFNDTSVHCTRFERLEESYTSTSTRTSYMLVYAQRKDEQQVSATEKYVLPKKLKAIVDTRLQEQRSKTQFTEEKQHESTKNKTKSQISQKPKDKQEQQDERRKGKIGGGSQQKPGKPTAQVKQAIDTSESGAIQKQLSSDDDLPGVHHSSGVRQKTVQKSNGVTSSSSEKCLSGLQSFVHSGQEEIILQLYDLSDDTLQMIAPHVSHCLNLLAEFLGIYEYEVKEIQQKYSKPHDISYRFLKRWVATSPKGDIDTLKTLLEVMVTPNTKIKTETEEFLQDCFYKIPDFVDVSDTTLNIIAEEDIDFWKELGKQLNIGQYKLEEIQDCYGNDKVCANLAVLLRWKEINRSNKQAITAKELKSAFQEIRIGVDTERTISTCLKDRKVAGHIPYFKDLNKDTLETLAQHTMNAWKKLGQNIKIPESKMVQYLKRTKGDNQKSCILMLESWTRSNRSGLLEELQDVYKDIGFIMIMEPHQSKAKKEHTRKEDRTVSRQEHDTVDLSGAIASRKLMLKHALENIGVEVECYEDTKQRIKKPASQAKKTTDVKNVQCTAENTKL